MPNLDPTAAFESKKARVEEAIREQFPYEGKKRRIELVSITFDEKADSPTDQHHIDNYKAQMDTKLKGMTWGVPIRATLRLVDLHENKTVEEQTVTLARLPKLTSRYSYVVEGHERQHDSVFRSKPRPYHQIAANGEIRARWNLARGRGFDIDYDPVKGKMTMAIGTANIPLYSILKALGVSDVAMRSAWGDKVYEVNEKAAKFEKDVDKAYTALSLRLPPEKKDTPANRVTRLNMYFDEETEVWPDAMKHAFGTAYTTVNGENLLKSSERLIAIQRGRMKEDPPMHETPDDRQSLSSKYLTTTEDFVVEAIRKQGAMLKRQVADRIDKPEYGISDIISPNVYKKAILAPYNAAQRPDQLNPLQFLSGYTRTTIRGEAFGGVGGDQTNLDVDKQINPTHLGFLDVIQTPESEDTGIALNLPLGVQVSAAKPVPGSKARVSQGQEIRTRVYDVKAKQMTFKTPAELEFAVVAYPDQVKWVNGTPKPIDKNVICYDGERRTTKRPWSTVQYVLPSAKALFAFSANLTPFLQNNSGNRAMMSSKQQEQAVSLVHREVPLVQAKTDGNATFDQAIGSFASHNSPVDGTVAKIEADAITIKSGNKLIPVPIYNHFPLNGGKNALHATPVVKVGQSVKKGQLLADTNFTKDGHLALGANLRAAYIPWKGLTFEDGIIISESAAKKMSSDHLYTIDETIYPGMIGGEAGAKARWRDYALPEHRGEHSDKLDDRGIVKEGMELHTGDVIIACLSPKQAREEDIMAAKIHKSMVKPYKDTSVLWEHSYPGKVVRVVVNEAMNRRQIIVHIHAIAPMIVGDKMTARHGNKGIVTRIIPDREMPHTKDGKHVEIILNPAGIPSRMNAGQILETAASKIARKTGKPYIVDNFQPGVDYNAKVQADLKKHGLSDTEVLLDPETGRPVGQVMVGDQYFLKLHHMVEKKQAARSFGTSYTGMGDAPSGSGIPGGGQKMDVLTSYALLSHGAHHNLREAQTYKSDADQNAVWAAVITGNPLPAPQSSRGMNNFNNYMRGMGINVEKKGDHVVLSPLTDAHVIGDKSKGIRGISNGEIKMPDKLLVAKGVRTIEEAGGLFDPKVTGGQKGKMWGHITLHERMPNPLFENAIQSVLGMKKAEYEKLVGDNGHEGKMSGFEIINAQLKKLDVDKELEREKKKLATAKRTELDRSLRRIKYLEALKKNNMTAHEAYTNAVIPVLPPSARPVSIGMDGSQVIDDRNNLYLSIGQANAMLKSSDKSMPHSEVQKVRAQLYSNIKALRINGLDTPGSGGSRHSQGIMELLSGKTDGSGAPKESYFQDGVLSRRQDLSGRSTIVPEPTLGLDEVGLPRPIAMEMYKPFIARELVRMGKSPMEAAQWATTKKDHPMVVEALHRAAEARPVLLKRDPSLHKYSIQAFKPRIVDGHAIQIHPTVTGGFNADFDGDTMAVYVPVSEHAVAEAHGMLPSNNIFSASNYGVAYVPGREQILGIFQATKWGEPSKEKDLTAAQAVKAMYDGRIKSSDVVTVGGKKTTPGRLSLAEDLPASMSSLREKLLYDPAYRINDKELKKIATDLGKNHKNEFGVILDSWKNKGDKIVFLNGTSLSLKDYHDGRALRDNIMKKYIQEEEKIRASSMSNKKKDQAVIELYTRARAELKETGQRYYNNNDNRMWPWAQSGARGNWDQHAQMTMTPVLVEDLNKKPVPVAIQRSYGEGLSVSEYMTAMHGARKGVVERSKGTSEPGALSKDIINTTISTQITAEDCGATTGIVLPVDHVDATDRFLAKEVKAESYAIPAGTLLTTALVAEAVKHGVKTVEVRSALHCRMQHGICAKCFGHSENGRLHAVGTNIGVLSGQSLGEPITQLVMKSFHTGGASGTGSSVVDGFSRIKQLFMVPATLPNAAVLSTVNGTVEKITKDERGGFSVLISKTEHRVVTGHLLDSIKVGAHVKKGDPLSTGPINPHHMLEQTGDIHRVRDYLTSEVAGVYGDKTRRRNIEVTVRAMTNLTQIEHAPKNSQYLRGEIVPLSVVNAHNDEAPAHEQIEHTPILKPMTSVPLTGSEDWLARLNYRKLKETYTEGAAQSWESDIHGYHPVPGLAYGAEFRTREPKALAPPTKKAK